MREAFSGQAGSDPYTIKMASQSGPQSESTRIQKLRQAIEAIEQRIEERSGNGISNDELSEMQKQLNQLSRKVAETPPPQQRSNPAPQPAPAPIATPAQVAAEAPQVRMKAPQPAASPAVDLSALSHQQDQALEVISRQFDVLKAEIATLKNNNAATTAKADHDSGALNKITAEINDLRTRMKKDVRREIATSSHMSTRLNELAEGVETLALQSGNAITPRVDDLSRQIDSMRLTIEDLPQTLSITSMEKRLSTIADKIDSIPDGATNDTDMTQVERRLDEIARGLVAVSNIGGRCDGKVMTRLEKRLAKLDETVATIAQARANQLENKQIEELAERIERLTGTLGSFEKYAENGDMGAATALFAGPDTSALEAQLAQLTARLDENTSGNSTAAQLSSLEAQMGTLVRQMNKSVAAPAVDFTPVEARLGQLETKIDSSSQFSLEAAQHAAQQAVSMLGANSDQGQAISALSSELASLQTLSEIGSNNNRSISEMQATLGQIVDRLGHIETSMSATNTASLMASTADPMPRAPQYDPEPHMAVQAASTLQAAQSIVEETNTSSYEFAPVMPESMQAVEAPSIDPIDDLNPALGQKQDMPLEPGAVGNPDLNRLVEEASAKLNVAKASYDSAKASYPSKASYGSGADNIKPDPIGAARRALKATTDEMKVEHDKLNDAADLTDEAAKASIFSRLSGLDLRKPIIVAAAATLLLLAATFGYKKLVLDTDASVAANQPATIEQTVKPADDQMSANPAPAEAIQTAEPTTAEAPTQPTLTQALASQEGAPTEITSEQTATIAAPQTTVTPSEADSVTLDTSTPTATAPEAVEPVGEKFADVDAASGPEALVTAAKQGDSKALFELGMRYSDGKLVARDMAASAKWFERSADNGYAPAQYSVGSLYEKGIGVEKNINTAAAWYAKAADQGNARAMHNLAVISATGAEPDMSTAINWFKQAGEYGIKDSQFNLGILYGQGMGVPQNLSESYKWFAIAAKTGDADAATKRDEVAATMDKADLAEAKAAVAAWKPAELNEESNKFVLPQEWRGKNQSAQNSIGLLIKQAQVSLNERGFAVGEPDGLIGPKTKAAIMEFQRAAGLPITGVVDKGLMTALGIKA